MRKKSYHPFYKVTILCEIIVRVRVRVTVRVRLSMLSVSVFSRYVVRVFQITRLINISSNWEMSYVTISLPQSQYLRIISRTLNVLQIHYRILKKYLRQKS